jgi:hypothetical protein
MAYPVAYRRQSRSHFRAGQCYLPHSTTRPHLEAVFAEEG